jgi:hypothetical protein
MILDVCSALAELLVPDPEPPAEPEIVRVVLDEEPLVWELGKLYVYPVYPVNEVPFETAGSRRQEFTVRAVQVVSNESEEAKQTRSEDLAEDLDEIRGAFLQVVRTNQSNAVWGFIRGGVDSTRPRMLDKRSAAIRVSGWRIIGG